MFNRILQTLTPKSQPELIRYRLRLARALILAFYILLLVWFVAGVGFRLFLASDSGYPFVLDGLSIIVSAILGASAMILASRQRIGVAGYLLATTFFIFATLGLFLFPQAFHLFVAAYLISILTAGAMIGGGSTYLFAIGSSISISISWILTWGTQSNPGTMFQPVASLLLLVSQIVLFIGTAAILFSLSNQVQRTIDHLHQQADRLIDLAQTDPLTNLANRRYFIELMEREFARARRYRRPLTLLYLDFDGFKELNDRHGHLYGDEVLRGATRSLTAVLRSTDLLARMGGDEFAVLLPETTLEGAQNVSQKLRRALIAYGQQLSPAIPSLTFCGGVSQLREIDTSIDDMLARADSAQYLAKETGKDATRTELDLVQITDPKT
jgi:diguanylate cyclase (GGDEF)-like protein